jgi:hypothetical protein
LPVGAGQVGISPAGKQRTHGRGPVT